MKDLDLFQMALGLDDKWIVSKSEFKPAEKRLEQSQPAGFGYPQAVPEHEQEQAPVAGLIPTALGGGNQAVNFGQN